MAIEPGDISHWPTAQRVAFLAMRRARAAGDLAAYAMWKGTVMALGYGCSIRRIHRLNAMERARASLDDPSTRS
ncbi:hypothetical protein [Caulobacter phage ERS]|uniref:Uncharacterized protein n=1 Tax=Caulobacter phage ERS TaxID=3020392 RepID=A0AAF0B761_9CAUD|nr:hypothetical protein [Caulobacter phage ERS]